MGLASSKPPVVPGSGSATVCFPKGGVSSGPRLASAAYDAEALAGYVEEIEWRQMMDRLLQVSHSSGEGVPHAACWFTALLVLFIICFLNGVIMTTIGCAVGGSGHWTCHVGILTAALFPVFLVAFVLLQAVYMPRAAKRWCSGAMSAVNTTLLPELRARFPLMLFSLRDLRDDSFTLHLERLPEGRDSQGHVIVAAAALDAAPWPQQQPQAVGAFASAPPKDQVMVSAGEGLKASLIG